MGDKKSGDNDTSSSSSKEVQALNQNQSLAVKTLNEFKKKNYTQALNALTKINDLKNESHELKLLHNKAVLEFFKSDLKKIDPFHASLQLYFNKANVTVGTFHNADFCVSFLNQAILDYYRNKYSSAVEIVDRLILFTESMDDKLICMLFLLTLELYACTNQPAKGLSFISTVESFLTKEVADRKQDADKNLKDALRSQSHKYSIQFHLQTNKLDEAIRELSTLNDSQEPKYVCLKALCELEKKENYQLALRILMPLTNTNKPVGTICSAISFNNQAVIYYKMGKFKLSQLFMEKALSIDMKQNCGTAPKSLVDIGTSKYYELSYNLGLTLFKNGDFVNAYEYLIVAVQRFHRSPMLWFRIAECCVQVYKDNEPVTTRIRTVGHGAHRKFILPSQPICDARFSYQVQSYAVPVPSLEFGLMCLENALVLIESDDEFLFDFTLSTFMNASTGNIEMLPSVCGNSCPTNPFTADQQTDLYNAVLLLYTYINLQLGNYIIVKEKVDFLLKERKISALQKYLANLYVAKALLNSDRIPEALKYLNPEQYKNSNLDYFRDLDFGAYSLMKFNLVVAFAIRGDYQIAINHLTNLSKEIETACKPQPIPMLMLMIYLRLQTGDVTSARNFLDKAFKQQKSD